MATIVLVHGIAQEQRSADDLEQEWLPALAGGVRNAGHPEVADRLWPPAGADRLVRMAFYGGLFRSPDQQGETGSDLDAEQIAAAEELATEWISNAAESTRARDAGTAQLELQALGHDPADAQGLGAVGGRAVAALDRIPWISRAGLQLARVNKALGQAVRYLTEDQIRATAIDAVHRLLDHDTRVVVAHSLGSVVAYEALRRRPESLPLLVTLGSPLGLNAVTRRLQDPPGFPRGVRRWINVADRDDIVAARPHLTKIFDIGRPPGAEFDSTYTVDNGAEPHRAGFYLTKTSIGAAIADALR